MPEIYRMYGIKIMMRLKEDHGVPHIHAKYEGDWASIRISDGEVLAGSLNRPALALVKKWLAQNRPAVMHAWDLAKHGTLPGRIGKGGSGRRHKAKRGTKTRSKSRSRTQARRRLIARRKRRKT